MRLSHRWLGGLLAVAVPMAFAASSALLHIEIPGRGGVVFAVPADWVQLHQAAARGEPPTLRLVQRRGPTFNVVVSLLGVGDDARTSPDPARLRAFVAEAARGAESQSVEKSLLVRELDGARGRGYYFVATDRAPAPGEWKCLTQGAIGVGGATVVFTILTNDGQESVVTAALDMVREASFEGPATST